ncbi:MAG: hypothetical protein AAF726_09145 [Planctomycetota bacterium]
MSLPRSLALPLSTAALALTASAAPNELTNVRWSGESVALDDLRDAADEEALAAISEHLARYDEWMRGTEDVVSLSEDLRVILIAGDERTSKKRMKLVEKTLEAFDGLMAPPDRSGNDEDFVIAEWGVGDHVPDAQPVVLIEVEDQDRYLSLVEGIGSQAPHLATWARTAAGLPGFAEEQVHAAAWQSAPDGYELGDVWRPENELVNRLARLLLHRSYGPQPTWLRVAVAWRVEMEVMDSIYCFPYRAGFVGIAEHGGWESELKSAFKRRTDVPVGIDEFARWERNEWDEESAQIAWGIVEYLARHEAEALPAIAEEFRVRYKAGYRTTHADGTWTTNPGFQVPMDAQREVLVAATSEDVLEQATEFFRKGKRYKPKRRR